MRIKTQLCVTTAMAAALVLGACRQAPDWDDNTQAAVCTDPQGNRVADSECDTHGGGHGGGGFAWYYLGRASAVPPVGDRVVPGSGSFEAGPGLRSARAPSGGMESVAEHASVSRGGFGESAHAFSGHGGGGE